MSDRTIAPKYPLKREIGRGGTVVIWEAFELALRRPAALELMTPQQVTSDAARRRFEPPVTTLADARK